MSYLQNQDDKLLDPNQQKQDQGQPQSGEPATVGGAPLVGGDSSAVQAGGVSTAGVGAGGQGKWTNIQAYLNANKNVDTGATQMVSDQVGSQFDKEQSDIDNESKDAVSKAQAQLNPIKEAKDNANAWLDRAAQSYDYSGNHASGYGDTVGKLKGALGAQYTGPKTFDHAFGADTQKYGENLASDDAFNKYLGDLYQNKAGGQLSSGGRALQQQLNVSNEPLQQARQNLLKRYSDLGDYRNLVASRTGKDLADTESAFRANQSGLKDYLTGQQAQAESGLSKAESDARAGYDTERFAGSGLGDFYNLSRDKASIGAAGNAGAQQMARDAAGLSGDNLSWDALQREQDNYGNYDYHRVGLSDYGVGAINERRDRNKAALDKFYADEDAKYQNTGDNEKRRYNTLAELLGVGNKKSQGFKVRG